MCIFLNFFVIEAELLLPEEKDKGGSESRQGYNCYLFTKCPFLSL